MSSTLLPFSQRGGWSQLLAAAKQLSERMAEKDREREKERNRDIFLFVFFIMGRSVFILLDELFLMSDMTRVH